MKIASLGYILFVLLLASCKDNNVAMVSDLPILGETTHHPITGEKVYYTAPDFSLTSQTGELCSASELEGKIQVVDFFFTSCPTICPKMTSNLKEVQQHFSDDDKVVLLSYSIDGMHDSPETLKSYAQAHGIDEARWKLLTGNPEEVFEVSKGYKVMAFDDTMGEEKNLIHDGTFVLLDSKRRIRGYYNGLDLQDTKRLISDIEKLLKTLGDEDI